MPGAGGWGGTRVHQTSEMSISVTLLSTCQTGPYSNDTLDSKHNFFWLRHRDQKITMYLGL